MWLPADSRVETLNTSPDAFQSFAHHMSELLKAMATPSTKTAPPPPKSTPKRKSQAPACAADTPKLMVNTWPRPAATTLLNEAIVVADSPTVAARAADCTAAASTKPDWNTPPSVRVTRLAWALPRASVATAAASARRTNFMERLPLCDGDSRPSD